MRKGLINMMEYSLKQIAERIKGLRELMDISPEEMAEFTDVTVDEYLAHESGESDFSFTFIYKCAERFGIDMVDILKGSSPTLSSFSISRKGEGIPIERREGFSYLHMAPFFKDKTAEPFYVKTKYSKEAEDAPISLSKHEGQELDIVIKGTLKVQVEDKTEILEAGDTIYYDSGKGHGMVAIGGEDCEFYAIVFKHK